jgi:DNA-binding beta-propeller fold protein YncE
MLRKPLVPTPCLALVLTIVLANESVAEAPDLAGPDAASGTGPLTVEARIPLGDVEGRIDHLAFDAKRARLYVAELGNDTIGVVDLKARRVIRTAGGFDEPQGIAYEPSTDTVYVANGGDGSVAVFRAGDFAAVGRIELGDDADNVRVDSTAGRVYVGHGDGALAVIDPATRTKVADIPLKGHPESFQLDPAGTDIFVNVPDAGEIAVVARDVRRQTASWPTGKLRANYPMTLDGSRNEVITIFRRPPRLERFQMRSGRSLAGTEVCADSDDVFADPERHRLYVICGEGFVDTFDTSGEEYTRAGRLQTSSGSRTGLYVAELDRLLVAIRASDKEPAAVWILRPGP